MHYAQIAQRAFNTPLLVEPAKAVAFLSGLGARLTGGRIEFAGDAVAPRDVERAMQPARAGVLVNDAVRQHYRDAYLVRDGIAVIEITGVLVHRGSWIGNSSGQTSYEGISAQLAAALADPEVKGIALELDCFGGEVAGAFDLADAIRAASAVKPVRAFVAEHAFSAAYLLASQADRVIVPRTGFVGSIGIVMMHTDMSGMLAQDGVKVTLIHAGARKVDANPYQPLPENVRISLQSRADAMRELFAQTVQAGRGERLTAEAALATEAESFRGSEAVAAGLADEVSDLASAFAVFTAEVSARRSSSTTVPPQKRGSQASQEKTMSETTTTTQENVETAAVVPPAAASSTTANTEAATRAECAELAQIATQAARLGVQIDAADAMAKGLKPDALRRSVLEQAAAASQASVVLTQHAPAADAQAPRQSSLVAKAKAEAEKQRSAG